LFLTNFRPTTAQITALAANPPAVAHISFILPGGGAGLPDHPRERGDTKHPHRPLRGDGWIGAALYHDGYRPGV
jgi:hypothetical protein